MEQKKGILKQLDGSNGNTLGKILWFSEHI